MSTRPARHRTVRLVAATALTAGIVTAGALAIPMITASAEPAAGQAVRPVTASGESGGDEFAPSGEAGIMPGVELLTELADGTASCTANFVFTQDDRVFLGSAAHCHAGGTDEPEGCSNESLPLGTPVTILGFDGQEYTAELAYSSWLTMQEIGETDEETCYLNDFALLEIAPEDWDNVNPGVPAFGGPEGLDVDGLEADEQVFSYQNAEDDPLPAMRAKQGTALGTYDSGWGHVVITTTPGLPGDSGSGYLDGDGEAFGVLSTVFEVEPGVLGNGVTDLAMAMDYAAAYGVGTVDLVQGTEPFSMDGEEMDPLPTIPENPLAFFTDGVLAP